MATYRLEREQWIPRPLSAVFDFFSRAENLGALTPAWVNFSFRTPLPVDMAEGAVIEYTLRIGPLPARWRTRVTVWEPESRFVDVQERGPYALWEHHHEFTPVDNGVLMRDLVRYALPYGALGRVVHGLAVRSMLAAIFDFRFEAIRKLFGESKAGAQRG